MTDQNTPHLSAGLEEGALELAGARHVRITVYLDADLAAAVDAHARKVGLEINAYTRAGVIQSLVRSHLLQTGEYQP